MYTRSKYHTFLLDPSEDLSSFFCLGSFRMAICLWEVLKSISRDGVWIILDWVLTLWDIPAPSWGGGSPGSAKCSADLCLAKPLIADQGFHGFCSSKIAIHCPVWRRMVSSIATHSQWSKPPLANIALFLWRLEYDRLGMTAVSVHNHNRSAK
jgi:hypothetical protein